jgi:mono/diheme cytochrome c family protein
MWFWNVLFNPGQRFQPNSDQSAEWNRGAYLVEALGHCGECHTPRSLLQGLKSGEKFAGATTAGWVAYNITPDKQSGLGMWSDEELVAYLASGHAERHGSASGPMGEVVENSLQYLTPGDIRAMVAYLKTVPAIRDAANLSVAGEQMPAATSTAQHRNLQNLTEHEEKLGARVFEGACASCHYSNGGGAESGYAALVGSRTVNDPAAVNLTQVILHGAHLRLKQGAILMPPFLNGYSDAEIAADANHVTGKFGAKASMITPDKVSKHRQAQ